MSERFIEERRHKRYVVKGIQGNVLYTSDLNVIDISLGGAAIETTKKIEVNREYPFKIRFKGRTINLTGIVVWSVLSHSKKTESGEVVPVYRAGVKFTNVMSEKANVLLEFIEENLVTTSDRRLKGVRCKIATSKDIKIDYPYKYNVKDMSLSGMLIKTEYPLDPNTTYNMELLLDENVLNIVGRIISCSEIEAGNDTRYGVRIEFVEMSEKERGFLKSFLDTLNES